MKGYVNNCGSLNLRTGKNAHFNVLDSSVDWSSATLTLFDCGRGKVRVVGGWSDFQQGEQVELVAATNHRHLAYATVIKTVPCSKTGLAELEGALESSRVQFGTWD